MRRLSLLACLAAISLPAVASAHIAMLSPTPRSVSQKQGPCGTTGSPRGDNIHVFRPGETITVSWDETVNHPGHYRIAFDVDGDDDFPLPNNPQDNFPTTLVDQIEDKVGGIYTQEVTLPDVECDNCTLQLIQVMTTNIPYNSFYFQCADIVLSNSAEPLADAGPGGTEEPDAGEGGGSGGDGSDAGIGGGDGGPPPTTGGCSTTGQSSGLGALLLLLGALISRRRRA